ncbi:hyaluronan and proteoglycan link protein 1-like [Trichomycterus rosablanca]|uniref:hyaluronan and proteoglycan link protein 1-like n=1 Tax=Trichomycterus rosablanca TaxID=2290929 RepID=UPI002F35489C
MISITCLALLYLSLANIAYTAEGRMQIFASPGDNVTMPCHLKPSSSFSFNGNRVKWTKIEGDDDIDILLSMGSHNIKYGKYENRAHLKNIHENDATLVIYNVDLDDFGIYKCEIINGMDDLIVELELRMIGVVFPYSPRLGHYNMNFHDAEAACSEQEAVVASSEQLHQAWKGGLDWCHAGWLSDGTVQYPITKPREPCGGANTQAGLRNYGRRDKSNSRFDVFCFTAGLNGNITFVNEKLTFPEAEQACQNEGAELAKVGQMFAAWKLKGYDRCDAGWLADGSVRYPISKPRMKCSPESGVHFVGFPEKKHKLYGAYCYKA